MRIFFATIIVALSCLALFNGWANVAGLGEEEIYALAKAQERQEALVSDGEFDQRAWVKGRLERSCPGTLVLGSSTLGAINTASVGQGELLNAWLTGPMVQDLQGVAHLLKAQNCAPQRIWVGVDGFLLDPRQSNDRWRTLWAERGAFVGDSSSPALHHIRAAWQRFKDLLSYQTTREGVGLLLAGEKIPSPGPTLVDNPASFCEGGPRRPRIRHADGHFSSCPQRAKTQEEVDANASTYAKRDMHGVRSWRRLDDGRLSALFEVLSSFQRGGSEVTLVTPPFHPLAYKALRSDAEIAARFDGLDVALKDRCVKGNIALHLLRDPESIGCGSDDFTDSHHGTEACGLRLVRAILKEAPAADGGL